MLLLLGLLPIWRVREAEGTASVGRPFTLSGSQHGATGAELGLPSKARRSRRRRSIQNGLGEFNFDWEVERKGHRQPACEKGKAANGKSRKNGEREYA